MASRCVLQAQGSRPKAHYFPRFPDLDAVCWGFILGGGGGATFVGFVTSTGTPGLKPDGLREKSGIPRGDFFFMGRLG